MSAAVIHLCAIVLVTGVGASVACELFHKPSYRLAMLAAGVVGGAAITVSGLYLLDDWGNLMEGVDFAHFDHTNPKRLPSKLYFLPSTTTALGAAASFLFGRRFYRVMRGLE